MHFISFYSTIVLAIFVVLSTAAPAVAQTYAIGDPMIVSCPSTYKGEMTVVETDRKQFPWQVLRWNCQGNQGLVSKLELEQYLQTAPPDKNIARRWEEKCPSGSIGVIMFSSHEERRFVDSWTCSIDGAKKMPFDELKRMLENKQTVTGASGLVKQHTCPSPYQGTYSIVYRINKWDLQQWTCAAPGAKIRVTEPIMRMLMPQ